MATYNAAKCKSATLATTNVDTVTITGGYPGIEVVNRGPGTIWVNAGEGVAASVPTPTATGDDVQPVLPNERVMVWWSSDPSKSKIVKIVGSGDAYTVIGVRPV